ncbi:DNA adenine methylase [Treponema pectinovorum]|uniref:DNA adenine methylase n=1 Tax=Treponema pectinovorum TaxID=164 RepID=UPI0011CA56D1|nr:DNA adenine methylase [Treponema pectinovorum]
MDFDSPYLTKQIIAYIGNKRKLLSLIYKALEESGIDFSKQLKFADLFSGSAVVSRFAKFLGFEVHCNDWEPYAKIIAEGCVKADKKSLKNFFNTDEEFLSFLNKMNSLPCPQDKDCYIAKYYAPKSDDILEADYKTERLFYTRQNALAIDKIRNHIEKEFPETSPKNEVLRNVLIANLLYEAATHTNTSGVFKAFHKEFGGHGKDALKRILSPIKLNLPELIDGKAPVFVYNEDANCLVKKLPKMDVVYLDPPYNQHQYGSNYHILNTIACWDKIPEPLELNEKGVLKNKAGIRSDWIKTRSKYCYKDTAVAAFSELIKNINADLILISYSSDGIIPFEQMKKIALERGYVSIVTSTYTTYRGGKQSNSRVNADIEFILVIDTQRKALKECEEKIDRIILEKKVLMLLKRRFYRHRLEREFDSFTDEKAILKLGNKKIEFPCKDKFTLGIPENFYSFNSDKLFKILTVLEKTICTTKKEELEQLLLLCTEKNGNEKKYIRLVPATLKKLAQKKYKQIFYEELKNIKNALESRPDLYSFIEPKILEIKTIAEIRFNT